MKDRFITTGISRTRRAEGGALDVQFVDATGRQTVIRVPADLALRLAKELTEFAEGAAHGLDATLTKRPKSFAVGTGRFDKFVLVRFEDDAPYALDADDAAELGEALIEQSETMALRPEKVLQ